MCGQKDYNHGSRGWHVDEPSWIFAESWPFIPGREASMNSTSRKRLGVVLVGLGTLISLGIAYLLGAPDAALALITLLGSFVAVAVVVAAGRLGS